MPMPKKTTFSLSLHDRIGKNFLLLMEYLEERYAEEPDLIIEKENINLSTKYGFLKYCMYYTFFAYKTDFFKWLKIRRENEDLVEEIIEDDKIEPN